MEAKDYVAAIRAHGLTQAQIAERTGIPQPTISKIERGDVSDVMSRNYRALQALTAELAQPPANTAPPATNAIAGQGA
jgi:transcriptional regulator with XRE-family HTH domain